MVHMFPSGMFRKFSREYDKSATRAITLSLRPKSTRAKPQKWPASVIGSFIGYAGTTAALCLLVALLPK